MERDAARLLPARDYLALKGATRDLVAAAGGHKRVGQISRTTTPKISEACSVHALHRFAAIDVIADLEAETGSTFVTACLADLAGHDLVARETGDVVAALALAIADGGLSDGERALLRKEVAQAMARLRDLDEAIVAKGRG